VKRRVISSGPDKAFVSVTAELHARLAARACAEGVSIRHLVEAALCPAIGLPLPPKVARLVEAGPTKRFPTKKRRRG
jgi:hypothetical protein